MIEEIEASIINELNSNKPCIPAYYVQRFQRIQVNDLLRIFIGIFTRDAGIKYDLLCHLIIFSNNKMHVQNQRYTNIQKGVIACSNGQSKQFFKNQIKQLKILAIFPINMANSTVQDIIDGFSNTKKSKEFQNKCTILPKLIVQNKTNNNKSKNKKEEKPKQEAKTEIQKQKKNLKKANSKSSIEMQPTKPEGLKKVSSKDQTPQPVLTSYQAERKKVQEETVEKKPKASLKMQLDSDEDYYNPQKPEELQRLISEKQVDTDMSGKKDKEQKMEIETQRQKSSLPKNNFIVNDDDEDNDEEDIFNKMDEISKKPSLCQTQQSSQSPKTEIHKPIQNKQPPKKALTVKQIPSNKPVTQAKPAPSLMGWLKPKQML